MGNFLRSHYCCSFFQSYPILCMKWEFVSNQHLNIKGLEAGKLENWFLSVALLQPCWVTLGCLTVALASGLQVHTMILLLCYVSPMSLKVFWDDTFESILWLRGSTQCRGIFISFVQMLKNNACHWKGDVVSWQMEKKSGNCHVFSLSTGDVWCHVHSCMHG